MLRLARRLAYFKFIESWQYPLQELLFLAVQYRLKVFQLLNHVPSIRTYFETLRSAWLLLLDYLMRRQTETSTVVKLFVLDTGGALRLKAILARSQTDLREQQRRFAQLIRRVEHKLDRPFDL